MYAIYYSIPYMLMLSFFIYFNLFLPPKLIQYIHFSLVLLKPVFNLNTLKKTTLLIDLDFLFSLLCMKIFILFQPQVVILVFITNIYNLVFILLALVMNFFTHTHHRKTNTLLLM